MIRQVDKTFDVLRAMPYARSATSPTSFLLLLNVLKHDTSVFSGPDADTCAWLDGSIKDSPKGWRDQRRDRVQLLAISREYV